MMPLIRPWSAEESEKLKAMAEAGASPIKIAAAMKRNVQAVRRQANRLGISLPTTGETRKRQRALEAEAIRYTSIGGQLPVRPLKPRDGQQKCCCRN